MNYQDSNKRLKSASGTAVAVTNAAANLPAYQPPAPIHIAGRGAAGSNARSPAARPTASASVDRSANGSKPGLRLTVKAPPSKLRNATSSSQQAPIPPNPYAEAPSESDVTPAPPTRAARSTRNPKAVVEPESDGMDEDAEGEDEDEEMDAEAEVDQELLANDDDDEDEDDEEDAPGEDEDMDDHPPPPIIKQVTSKTGRPDVTVTAPEEGPLKSVEAKEMDDDDDELSELEEGDENENENENEEDDEEDDSDLEDNDNSRSATPDLSKLTRRQRGFYEDTEGNLMALSNEAQKKKHLSAEEHAMRRQEMARRRKNLSERRNEEEKMDTINKLLKKPAPKRRTRAEIIAAQQAEAMATPGLDDGEEEKPDPLFARYVQNREGARLGVPGEWFGGVVGEVFGVSRNGQGFGRLVEEVT